MQQNVTSFNNQKGDAVDVTCYGSKESNAGFEESSHPVHRAVGNLDFEVKLEPGHQSIYRASPMDRDQALYKAYLLKMTRSHFPFLSCRGRLHSDHRLGSRTKIKARKGQRDVGHHNIVQSTRKSLQKGVMIMLRRTLV
ncbi:uncharacterized protein EAE97_000915 [Botrytis byssoidea]|uniref:Uncharacterized protein n=1 Tax=Botrytis byssoidea TaxID=139641 RepID=A0A9P5ITF7_9HELO|nr:uncharacterized protein EAE97_000915 [Botrytis byssoidea]KAF7953516.1 hypothetical protein EAE97_000915 [Botrytis byssoidea]